MNFKRLTRPVGNHALVQRIRELQDRAEQLTPIAGDGVMVNPVNGGHRFAVKAKPSQDEGSILLERFMVKTVEDDYLICHPTSNGDGSAIDIDTDEEIKIAKCPEFRKTTWHNVSVGGYTFEAATGTNAQRRSIISGAGYDEELFPRYSPLKSLIYAARVPSNAEFQISANESTRWQEINNGRQWRTYRPVREMLVTGFNANNFTLDCTDTLDSSSFNVLIPPALRKGGDTSYVYVSNEEREKTANVATPTGSQAVKWTERLQPPNIVQGGNENVRAYLGNTILVVAIPMQESSGIKIKFADTNRDALHWDFRIAGNYYCDPVNSVVIGRQTLRIEL